MKHTSVPKYLRLSQRLEKEILNGQWDEGRLPPLREIAAENGVSVVTAARAIQVLRDKKLISRIDRSGSYPVRPAAAGATEKWAFCINVTQGTWHSLSKRITHEGFELVGRRDQIEFVEPFHFQGRTTSAEMLKQVRKASEEGVAGLFLLPSRLTEELREQDEALLSACTQAHMPVVLLDRKLRGHGRKLERDLVAPDDYDAGYRAGAHLIEGGCQKIGVVVGSPTSSHDERVGGFLQAARLAGRSLDAVAVMQLPDMNSSKDTDRWLAGEVEKRKLDGVFCYQDSVAVSLIMELLSRGVGVPGDVSVAGCENLPIGDMFTLGVTTYTYPAEEIVTQAVRLMKRRIAEPNAMPVRVMIPGELIVRESTKIAA